MGTEEICMRQFSEHEAVTGIWIMHVYIGALPHGHLALFQCALENPTDEFISNGAHCSIDECRIWKPQSKECSDCYEGIGNGEIKDVMYGPSSYTVC
jgi:hypothetical protein